MVSLQLIISSFNNLMYEKGVFSFCEFSENSFMTESTHPSVDLITRVCLFKMTKVFSLLILFSLMCL